MTEAPGGPGPSFNLDDLAPSSASAQPNAHQQVTKVSPYDVDVMLLFLGKARNKAEAIRQNATAGSYLDTVLHKTISGIDQEMAQLKYLLSQRDLPDTPQPSRMRPAV